MHDALAGFAVRSASGLVGEDEIWVVGHRPGDGLSAG